MSLWVRKLYIFSWINGFLLLLSALLVVLPETLLEHLAMHLFKNAVVLLFVATNMRNKKSIGHADSQGGMVLYAHFVLSTLIEGSCTYCFVDHAPSRSVVRSVGRYYALSFFLEAVFDFFHYWVHRILHSSPLLYQRIHKKHHRYHIPVPLATFYQNPLDVLVATVFPAFLVVRIFNLDAVEYALFSVYKTFTEVSGHCGRITYPTPCFPQCIWLPRMLGISLYAEDHYLHHARGDCNYSKRLSLWDRVFDTYVPANTI